jgi:hypothetical protein
MTMYLCFFWSVLSIIMSTRLCNNMRGFGFCFWLERLAPALPPPRVRLRRCSTAPNQLRYSSAHPYQQPAHKLTYQTTDTPASRQQATCDTTTCRATIAAAAHACVLGGGDVES